MNEQEFSLPNFFDLDYDDLVYFDFDECYTLPDGGTVDLGDPTEAWWDSGFPWPFSLIQEEIEEFWSQITSIVPDLFSKITNWLWDKISWLYDTIWGWFDDLWNNIKEWLFPKFEDLKMKLESLWSSILNIPNTIWGWISSFRETVWGWFSWLWDKIRSDFFPRLSEVANNIVSKLEEWASKIVEPTESWGKKIFDKVVELDVKLINKYVETQGELKEHFDTGVDKVISAFDGAFKDFLSGFVDKLKEFWSFMFTIMGEVLGNLFKVVEEHKGPLTQPFMALIQPIVDEMTEATKLESPSEPIKAMAVTLASGMQNMISEVLERYSHSPMSEDDALGASTMLSMGALGVSLAGLVVAGLIDLFHPLKEMRAGKTVEKMLDIMKMPEIASLALTVPIFVALRKPLERYWNKIFTPNIPSAQDLITFSVREVFTRPELEEEFPEEFGRWMKLQGFSERWARAYWAAHWRLPGVEQVYEMYHRGIISEEEMKEFLKFADYHREWRDKLLAISWSLPTRIDLRWMFEWGILSKEEAGDFMKKTGLDPEWVPKVMDAYERNLLRDEIGRLRTQIRSEIKKGYATEDELTNRFSDLLLASVIDADKELARREKEEYLKDLRLDILEYDLKYARITREEFIAKVTEIIKDKEIAEALADKILSRRKEIKENEAGERFRTRVLTTLKNLYKEGFILPETLEEQLRELNYTEEEIKMITLWANLEYAYDYMKDLINIVVEEYRKGRLTDDELQAKLIEMGVRPERALAILRREQLRKMPKPKGAAS